jgi:phage-related minor tail protein
MLGFLDVSVQLVTDARSFGKNENQIVGKIVKTSFGILNGIRFLIVSVALGLSVVASNAANMTWNDFGGNANGA